MLDTRKKPSLSAQYLNTSEATAYLNKYGVKMTQRKLRRIAISGICIYSPYLSAIPDGKFIPAQKHRNNWQFHTDDLDIYIEDTLNKEPANNDYPVWVILLVILAACAYAGLK